MSFYRSGTDPGKRKGPADDNGAFANKWICSSVVILQTQVRDQVFAHDVAQRVLQFHRLNEQIVLWIETLSRLWRLEIKAQPILDADERSSGVLLARSRNSTRSRAIGAA